MRELSGQERDFYETRRGVTNESLGNAYISVARDYTIPPAVLGAGNIVTQARIITDSGIDIVKYYFGHRERRGKSRFNPPIIGLRSNGRELLRLVLEELFEGFDTDGEGTDYDPYRDFANHVKRQKPRSI